MGWLRLVGSSKLYLSSENIGLFRRALLQKRPVILRSLLIIATPYSTCSVSHTALSLSLSLSFSYSLSLPFLFLSLSLSLSPSLSLSLPLSLSLWLSLSLSISRSHFLVIDINDTVFVSNIPRSILFSHERLARTRTPHQHTLYILEFSKLNPKHAQTQEAIFWPRWVSMRTHTCVCVYVCVCVCLCVCVCVYVCVSGEGRDVSAPLGGSTGAAAVPWPCDSLCCC